MAWSAGQWIWKDDILIQIATKVDSELSLSVPQTPQCINLLLAISPYMDEIYLYYTWFHSIHHGKCTDCVRYKFHGSSWRHTDLQHRSVSTYNRPIYMQYGISVNTFILPSSHLAPSQPVAQAQWPGRMQCPPFAHPLGKQIAGERLNTHIADIYIHTYIHTHVHMPICT